MEGETRIIYGKEEEKKKEKEKEELEKILFF